MRLGPVAGAIVLAGVSAAALLADRVGTVAVLVAVLLGVILRFGQPGRRRLYVIGALTAGVGVMVVWPFVGVYGTTILWEGPTVPVLGRIDVTVEELEMAALQALRVVAVGLAFSAYALLVDHDRLLVSLGFLRRSAFTAVLATRLVPTLERDAAGLAEAVRGRGLEIEGVRARARLVSPLVAGSLERALNLAESMEARGFGRPGRTSAPRPGWSLVDRLAVCGAAALVAAGALWL